MENTRVRVLAFVLLFLSGTVSAAVSTRTVDLGEGGIFEDVDGHAYTDLQHKYIFDLPRLPPLYQSLVTAGVTFELRATNDPLFTVTLYDSHDHLLSTATVSDDTSNPNENGRVAILFRYLPPGEDYYALVTGHSNFDVTHRVFIYSQLSTIPEHETYAMFIAGLGLLGWKLRRT
jgi:hypothetical protein